MHKCWSYTVSVFATFLNATKTLIIQQRLDMGKRLEQHVAIMAGHFLTKMYVIILTSLFDHHVALVWSYHSYKKAEDFI